MNDVVLTESYVTCNSNMVTWIITLPGSTTLVPCVLQG